MPNPIKVTIHGELESDMKIVLHDDAAFGFFIERDGNLYEAELTLFKVEMDPKHKGCYSSSCAMDELGGSGFDKVSVYAQDNMTVVGDIDAFTEDNQRPLVNALTEKKHEFGMTRVM